MTYTILSAAFANQDSTAAILLTEEAGHVLISSADTPDEWAELLTWAGANSIAAYVPPPAPGYWLYKSVFISRLSSNEAVTMEAVLAAADAKLRLMFNSVEYFVSDDPLFATLHAAVAAALGETRATELLSAETAA